MLPGVGLLAHCLDLPLGVDLGRRQREFLPALEQ
jgi:hypothetical protein